MHRRDDLPSHPKGPYYYLNGLLDDWMVSSDAVFQHEDEAHSWIHGSMVDVARRLVNVFMSGVVLPTGELFRRGVNSLDDVMDSPVFRKLGVTYTDLSNRLIRLYRAGVDTVAEDLFRRGVDSLDDILNSANWNKVGAAYSSVEGSIIRILRGVAPESADNLFKRGENTLDDVVNSPFWKKVASEYIGIEGQISAVFRSLLVEPAGNLFKRGENSLGDVADDSIFRRLSVAFTDTLWRLIALYQTATGVTAPGDNVMVSGVTPVTEAQLPSTVAFKNRENVFSVNQTIDGAASIQRVQGTGTINTARDSLIMGPDAENFFMSRSRWGKFIFNYLTPKPPSENSVFEVYNNGTDLVKLIDCVSKGGGLDETDKVLLKNPFDSAGNPLTRVVITPGTVDLGLVAEPGTLQISY